MENKNIKTFDDYMGSNPRLCFPTKEMEEFVKFAQGQYIYHDGVVNCCHCENEEETLEETKQYIGESMEALLLYKKFLLRGKNDGA